MKKFIVYTTASSLLLLTSLPGMAQRGLLGGHASTSSRISASSMNHAGLQSRTERSKNVRAITNSKMQTRSNAEVRDKGLARASATQSVNTKADSNRDFTVAPGVGKSEARTSSKTNAGESSSTSLKANGLVKAQAAQSANTQADGNRDFAVAPGMSKAEVSTSSGSQTSESSSTTLKANGLGKAQASQSASVGARAHSSHAGKIKHHLHL